MSGSTNGRVLRIAIAGSLAVHLIVATLVHPREVQAQPQQKPAPTTIIHLIPPPPKPTPPPPQPAQRHPRNSQTHSPHRPPVHVPITHTRDTTSPPGVAIASEPPGPPDTGTTPPDGGPTDGPVAPEPTATPKPACSAPDVAARAVTVQSPNTPDDEQSTNATAKIRVDLDADGNVLGVSVYESAGSMELDRAALQAARASRYAPEEKDCKKIPGSYLFTVDFASM